MNLSARKDSKLFKILKMKKGVKMNQILPAQNCCYNQVDVELHYLDELYHLQEPKKKNSAKIQQKLDKNKRKKLLL